MKKIYRRGADKERRIVNAARKLGKISLRSAGSHSPIDVVTIDLIDMTVRFIQCKGLKFPDSEKRRLEKEYKSLNGYFKGTFEVI